jgi:hypothetical protein
MAEKKTGKSSRRVAVTLESAPSPELQATVSDEVLNATPERVLKFLVGISSNKKARSAMQVRGFSQEDGDEAWLHLKALTAFEVPGETLRKSIEDRTAAHAIATLDAWDEGGFRIVEATLRRHYPAQAAAVLAGISASKGPAAVLGVATLLDRIDALEAGSPEDQAAAALLAKRGIDASERARLKKLVVAAQTAAPVAAAGPAEADRIRRRNHLIQLRAWYEEWTAVARVAITQKAALIALGLAHRSEARRDETPAPSPADG